MSEEILQWNGVKHPDDSVFILPVKVLTNQSTKLVAWIIDGNLQGEVPKAMDAKCGNCDKYSPKGVSVLKRSVNCLDLGRKPIEFAQPFSRHENPDMDNMICPNYTPKVGIYYENYSR